MKKWTILIVVLAALLVCATGCGKKEAPSGLEILENLPPVTEGQIEMIEETTEATTAPTEPDSVLGTVTVNKAGVIVAKLPRGEQVEILEEKEDCYVVNTSAGPGLMEKRLIRKDNQEQPEPWTGYARWKAALYDGYHMAGEGVSLKTNAKFQVLEDLGGCYLVQTEEGFGYIPSDFVSKYPIRSSSSGKSDNSGGGDSGSSGSSGGSAAGQDGGDISLTASRAGDFELVLLSNRVMATVLADDAEVYVMYLNRGDSVKVTEYDEETCTIYLDGFYAQLPRMFVRLDEDALYEEWTAYARWNAEAYSNPYLLGEPARLLKTNTEVKILEDLGYCYVAEMEGEIFTLRPDQVSKWKATSGGNKSNSGSDGASNGGSGGSSSNGGEWTPPAL